MEITRVFEFPAGHRLLGHEGRCKDLHGHNYRAEVRFRAGALDAVGRVIDFDVLRTLVWDWLEANWDHRFLLCRDDADAIAALRPFCGPRGPYVMDNPTAENMARELFEACARIMQGRGVEVVGVRLWEMSDCSADYP